MAMTVLLSRAWRPIPNGGPSRMAGLHADSSLNPRFPESMDASGQQGQFADGGPRFQFRGLREQGRLIYAQEDPARTEKESLTTPGPSRSWRRPEPEYGDESWIAEG